MKRSLIAAILLTGVQFAQAATKPAATVQATKGPVQITLSLYKTTVKIEKNLWYKITLKNVGKKKLRVDDWIFKDPWGMAENCRHNFGIYLEILDPQGKPLSVRSGGDTVHYDWEPKEGELLPYSPEELKEIDALKVEWKKRGLTEQQQHLALNDWNNENNTKKNRAEMADPTKQLWLEPGTSTTTFAWMDRGPGKYADRSKDDVTLSQGYTQLWSYDFFDPGKYRIRAVYDYAQPESTKALFRKHGHEPHPDWVKFKTPFVTFEVLP